MNYLILCSQPYGIPGLSRFVVPDKALADLGYDLMTLDGLVIHRGEIDDQEVESLGEQIAQVHGLFHRLMDEDGDLHQYQVDNETTLFGPLKSVLIGWAD